MNTEKYIQVKDYIKDKNVESSLSNWINDRKTIELLGMWESNNNPDFNKSELEKIKKDIGINLLLTPKKWAKQTNAIGITIDGLLHPQIASDFFMWSNTPYRLNLMSKTTKEWLDEILNSPIKQESKKETLSSFDLKIKQAINYNPKK